MTEWDKLWGQENHVIDKSDGEYNWAISKYYLYDIKAVGDAMQKENNKLKEDLELEQAMKNQKLKESEALLQLANGRCNGLAKQLGETQLTNETLQSHIDQMRTDCLKLEAIRGLLPKLKCDRCIGWVGEPCSEKCDHLIYKKIYDVLGVLKEMQEKEQ